MGLSSGPGLGGGAQGRVGTSNPSQRKDAIQPRAYDGKLRSGLRSGDRFDGVPQEFVRVRHPFLGLRQRYGSTPQLGNADVPSAKRRVKLGLRQLQFGSRFLDQRIRHSSRR